MGKYLDKTGLTYLWGKIKGAFVKKSGDTMTGTLTLTSGNVDVQQGNLWVGGDINYRGITIKGASGSPALHIRNTGARLTFDQYANGSAGGERYLLPTPETRSADAWYSILTNKTPVTIAQGGTGATTLASGQALIGNGTNAVQTRSITNVTSGSATASTNLVTANTLVSHVANKLGGYLPLTGGTLTGTTNFKSAKIDITTAPSLQQNEEVFRVYDKNSNIISYIRCNQLSGGAVRTNIGTQRKVGSNTIYNAFSLDVHENGLREVSFSDKSLWLSALGLLQESGDEYSETSTCITGIIRGSAKQFVLRVTLPGPMESNTIAYVSKLTGWMVGYNGVIGGSGDNTNWLTLSGVSNVRASIKSSNTLLIVVETSSALTNAINGPLSFYGSFTIGYAYS